MHLNKMKDSRGREYTLVPPEGGWGYVVTISVSILFISSVVPVAVFGMVFGKFLASVGDETYGITLVNGIFNTVLSFTGLAANHLLQKYSCRKVGMLGAIIFTFGALGSTFVGSLFQLIITFGVVQGIGFGLIMPSGFTSFNGYFAKRQNVMMGLAQVVIVGVTMLWPGFTSALMKEYGWRGTQLIFAGLSLHLIVGMIALQPVKWHMKKKYADNAEVEVNPQINVVESEEPLLIQNTPVKKNLLAVQETKRPSLISIGSMAASVNNVHKIHIDETKGLWKNIYDALDLELFKSPKYVNIAFGLALSLTADLAFLSLLPMILRNANYSQENTTLVLTVYFACDLICRILLSVVSAVMHVRNRYVFLAGSLLSAAFRTAFIMDDSLWWVITTCGALGFLRCFIQTPLPLVVAEEYGPRFSTAFTLYMVVCGVVSCIFGPLLGFVKEATHDDRMVVHLLTTAYLLCGVPWTIELICTRLSGKKEKKEVES